MLIFAAIVITTDWPISDCGVDSMRQLIIALAGLLLVFSGEALCQNCFTGTCKRSTECAVVVAPANICSLPVAPERICNQVVAPERICAIPVAPRPICGRVVAPARQCNLPVAPQRLCGEVVSPRCIFELPVAPERLCTKWIQEMPRHPRKCR